MPTQQVFMQADHAVGMVAADVRARPDDPTYQETQRTTVGRPAKSVPVGLQVLTRPHTDTPAGFMPLPDTSAFIAWCQSSLGIGAGAGKDRPVLCFDDLGGAVGAARLWWMLTNLGVEAYILDGGWQAYQKAGLPTESGPEREARQSGGEAAAWAYRAAWSDVVEHPDALAQRSVVDSRPPECFLSTVRAWDFDSVPGAVPNASSLPWLASLAPNPSTGGLALKPTSELQARYRAAFAVGEEKGAPCTPQTHASYCAWGVTACFNIAVAAHVGLGTPALFPGSWSMVEAVQGAAKRAEAKEKYGVVVTKVVRGKPFDAAKPTKLEAKTEGGGEGVLLESAVEAALMENLRAGEEVVVEVKSGPSPLSVTAA